MPINTFNSNLRVETNVNGQIVDNDEYTTQKAHQEHSFTENVPWSQNYVSPEEQARALYEDTRPVEDDPKLRAANTKDLKIRNLNR